MMTNVNPATDDPMDAASNATLAPRSYYGQIQIDAYFCVLVKGTGKVPFDPQQHAPDKRCTALDISILPLAEQHVTYTVQRNTIAESREWAGIIWPSLKALGLTSVRQANGAWAKMQQVPSGRKYTGRDGQEKESTTFKFLALYPDEAACRAAYLAEGGKDNSAAAPVTDEPLPMDPPASNTHDLEVATQFIRAFAKQNGYKLDETRAACASQTIITKALDINSQTFADIVAQAVTA